MCVTNFTESEQWDTVIEGNDDLLEKYMSGKSLEALELEQEESIRFQNCSLFPLYHGSAKSNIGIDNLIEVITNKFIHQHIEVRLNFAEMFSKLNIQKKTTSCIYTPL